MNALRLILFVVSFILATGRELVDVTELEALDAFESAEVEQQMMDDQFGQADPTAALMAATFQSGSNGLRAVADKDATAAWTALDQASGSISNLNIRTMTSSARNARTTIQELNRCYVFTFTNNDVGTSTWSLLTSIPGWLKLQQRPTAISVCNGNVRVVVGTLATTKSFFSFAAGWVLFNFGGSEPRASARLPVTVTAAGKTTSATLTGSFPLRPYTFRLRADLTSSPVLVRELASASGIPVPTLPSPLNTLADLSITRIQVGYTRGTSPQSFVAALGNSNSNLLLFPTNIQLLGASMGVMYSCPDGSSLLEVHGLAMGAKQIATRMRRKTGQTAFLNEASKFLASNKAPACISFTGQTKLKIGVVEVPFMFLVDSTGVYFSLAGPLPSGGGLIPNLFDSEPANIQFTLLTLFASITADAFGQDLYDSLNAVNTKLGGWLLSPITVSVLRIDLNPKPTIRLEATTTFEGKPGTTLNAYFGAFDKVGTAPPALAVVAIPPASVTIDSLVSKLLGTNTNFFNTQKLFIVLTNAPLDTTSEFRQQHLNWMFQNQPNGFNLPKGLTMLASAGFNKDSSNTMVRVMASIYSGPLAISATIGPPITLQAVIPRITLHPSVAIVEAGVALSYSPPTTVGLTFQAGLEFKTRSNTYLFMGYFGASQTGPVTVLNGALAQRNPITSFLGIPTLDLTGVSFEVGYQVSPPPQAIVKLAGAGGMSIGNVLRGNVAFSFDLLNPMKDYIYGKLSEVDACKAFRAFLSMCKLDPNLAPKFHPTLCEMFTWPETVVGWAWDKVFLPTGFDPSVLPAGLTIVSAIPLPLSRIYVNVRVVPPIVSTIFAHTNLTAWMNPVNFPGVFQLCKAADDCVNGPRAEFVYISVTRSAIVEFNAYAKLFNFLTGGASLTINPLNGLSLNAFFVVNAGLSLRVNVSAVLDASRPINQNTIRASIEVNDLNFFQNKIRELLQGFANALNSAAGSLSSAASAVSKSCNDPNQGCRILNCGSLFLETGVETRTGANLALYQRQQLASRRIRRAVAGFKRLQARQAADLARLIQRNTKESTQPLLSTIQHMAHEQFDYWTAARNALLEEFSQIWRGIHKYHDIKEMKASAKEKAAAERKLAAEHTAAIEEYMRFADSEAESSTLSMNENEFEELFKSELRALVSPRFQQGFWDKIGDGFKKVGEGFEDLGNKIADTAGDVWDATKSAFNTATGWGKQAVEALAKQAAAIGSALCKGAVRVCIGACATAAQSLKAGSAVAEWTADGVKAISNVVSIFEIRRVSVGVSIGGTTGVDLAIEYRFGPNSGFTTKSIQLQVTVTEAFFQLETFAKLVWEQLKESLVRGLGM